MYKPILASMQSKAVTVYSWTYLGIISEDSSLSLVAVTFFRWWGSPLRAAARHCVLPLQCVVVPGLVPVCAPGGEKVTKLLPWVVKLWWARALPTPR